MQENLDLQTNLESLREKANSAFDQHCKQWELLNQIKNLTTADLTEWLASRDYFFKVQSDFEIAIRKNSETQKDS
jgi:hypothetical protein